MIHIVLVEPEIPQNTGNIARSCACTGMPLHLIRPLGFEISDKTVKRAGLDYWDKLNLSYYDSFEELKAQHPNTPFFYLSTKAQKTYDKVKFPPECFLVFGKESKGLDESLIYQNPETAIRIPMKKNIRSLNLSNCVAIMLYEALKQNNFLDLEL